MKEKREVFFVSDSTGITVESLGRSVLAQFDGIEFVQHRLSFVDDIEKANAAAEKIRAAGKTARPLLFYTFANENLAEYVKKSGAMAMDCLEIFIRPLEAELGISALHSAGVSHSVRDKDYQRRIDALHFAMDFDDGASVRGLEQADLILIGVSRSGKTPTSFYLALHFGIFTANYPLVEEDLTADTLPESLVPHKHKLFGLIISPTRLAQIREQRRPNSNYASREICEHEVRAARRLYAACNIPFLDATQRSVEELSSKILKETGLLREDS